MKRWHLFRLCLSALPLLAAGRALAQTEPPEPEPAAAPSPSPEAGPAGATAPATGVAAGGAAGAASPPRAAVSEPAPLLPSSVEGSDAAEPGPEPRHKKHKKRGKKRHGAAAGAAAQDGTTESIPGMVFASGGGSIEVKGRVLALAELSQRSETVVSTSGGLTTRDRTALDLLLDSARLGVEYRSPLRWLSAELELEAAGKVQVKDAYIKAGKRFFARAGQFKLASSVFELESRWTLPTARRGLLHDLLTDWLDVAGRRPGLELGYRGKGDLKPRLVLGAFQGTSMTAVAPGDRDVELLDRVALDAQSLAARAEVSLRDVALGAWYEHRVGSQQVGEFSHFPTFGVDAAYDRTFESGGLRAWVDGMGGESLYVHADKPDAGGKPWYLAGRALLAYRFGGVFPSDPYLEPFGFFGAMDPDLDVVADFVSEAALGLNAGYWQRARVTLQAEMTSAARNFPQGFLDNVDPEQLSVLLLAGARF